MINKNVKSVLTVFAVLSLFVLFMFGFTACAQNYSKDSIKNNLESAGYSVVEGEKIVFADGTDTSTLPGIQAVLYVTKGTGADKEAGFILVFDSIGNADKLSDTHLVEIGTSAEGNCGSGKIDSVKIGRWNNVAFGGCESIKKAAKIN